MSKIPIAEMHSVYWGSHGCNKRKGHANPCKCQCGEYYRGTHVYGDEAESAIALPIGRHRKEENVNEKAEETNSVRD